LQARFRGKLRTFSGAVSPFAGTLPAASEGFPIGFFAACVVSVVFLVPWLGQDFFPAVDSGQFKLHLRARTGTRIEETARLCDLV